MSEPKRFKMTATIILWAPSKQDAESMIHTFVDMDSDVEGVDIDTIEESPDSGQE